MVLSGFCTATGCPCLFMQIEQLVDENRRLSGSVASGKQSLELQRHRHQQDYSALEQQLEAMVSLSTFTVQHAV